MSGAHRHDGSRCGKLWELRRGCLGLKCDTLTRDKGQGDRASEIVSSKKVRLDRDSDGI